MTRPLRSLRNRLALIFGLIVAGRDRDRLPLRRAAAGGRAARRRSSTPRGVAPCATSPPLRERSSAPTRRSSRRERADGRGATRARAEVTLLDRCGTAPRTSCYPVARLAARAATRSTATSSGRRATPRSAARPVRGDRADRLGAPGDRGDPLSATARSRGVAVFADALDDVAGQRRADPPPHPRRRRRSRSCSPRSAATSWRARCRGASSGSSARRARSPRATSPSAIQADSDDELGQLAAAFDDMQGQLARLDTRAQAVHRDGLARAAHADLLARRLPRAARGRGARRGDPRASSSTRCAARSTACASSRPSCSTSRGWSPARSSCARSRPTSAQLAREVAGEFTPARRRATTPTLRCSRPATRSRSSATPSAWRR